MYELAFSKVIDSDIDHCYIYIKETMEAPKAAENLFNELYEKINGLLENPYRRPLVHDKYLASLGIRSINVKNYTMFYSILEETKQLIALRFMYTKRDWINIFKEEPLEKIM